MAIMYNYCQLLSLVRWMVMISLPRYALITSSDAFVLKHHGPSCELGTAPVSVAHIKATCRQEQFSWQRYRYTVSPTRILEQRPAGDADDAAASKGIVSLLTDVVNAAFDAWAILFHGPVSSQSTDDGTRTSLSNSNDTVDALQQLQPPSSPFKLLERIRSDYTERNYLWTGDLDVAANFIKSCRFTDPTLSFVGTDKYIKNIQNLRPILTLVTDVETECRSELLDIQLYDNYIQTRWNMIGTLSRLPWKPKIDVIGKTKFWYQNDTNQIYFYDEIWEIPANQALLQLVTPTNGKS